MRYLLYTVRSGENRYAVLSQFEKSIILDVQISQWIKIIFFQIDEHQA